MKQLFLIPALALTLSPLSASNLGWPDIFGPNGLFYNQPADGGVFGGAQPKTTPADPDPAPDANPAPQPAPAPAPMTSLSLTGAGLLDFVFQQSYSALSGEEAERVRAVLAPQYAQLALYLQGAFGSDQVNLPPELVADPPVVDAPANATVATLGVTVTQAMAVVAATTLLNDVTPPPAAPAASDTSTGALSLTAFDTFQTVDTPEPATLLLAAAGLALACVAPRRR